MGNTKKVKSAGRYGSKFGVGIRKRLVKVESKQRKKYKCPKCGFKKIKRTAIGIFVCKKCNAKFSGGAYFPNTLSGTIVRKMVSQKNFSTAILENLASEEEKESEKKEHKERKEHKEHEHKEHNKEKAEEKHFGKAEEKTELGGI